MRATGADGHWSHGIVGGCTLSEEAEVVLTRFLKKETSAFSLESYVSRLFCCCCCCSCWHHTTLLSNQLNIDDSFRQFRMWQLEHKARLAACVALHGRALAASSLLNLDKLRSCQRSGTVFASLLRLAELH